MADIDSWLTLDPASSPGTAHTLSFTAKTATKSFKLLPLHRVVDQFYTAHFNISVGAVQIKAHRGFLDLTECAHLHEFRCGADKGGL